MADLTYVNQAFALRNMNTGDWAEDRCREEGTNLFVQSRQ